MTSMRTQVVRGSYWGASSQILRFLVSLGTLTVLARYLAPADFGIIAVIVTAALLTQTLADLGLSVCLVRQPPEKLTSKALATVFWFKLGSAIAAACFMVLAADFIAALLDMPDLRLPLQASAIVCILTLVHGVPKALLERELRFGAIAGAEFFGALAGALVALGLAIAGFGIWALIGQHIVFAGVATAIMAACARWRPSLEFSWSLLSQFVGFGVRYSGSTLVSLLSNHADRGIIASSTGAIPLGNYAVAAQITDFPSKSISELIQRLTLSVLSKTQNDDGRTRYIYLRTVHACCVVAFPMMLGIAALSDQIITLVLGPGWELAAQVLPYLAIAAALSPVNSITSNLYLARGEAGLHLRMTLLGTLFSVVGMLIGAFFGLEGIAIGRLAGHILVIGPLWGGGARLIGLSLLHVLRVVLPVTLSSMIMWIGVSGAASLIDLPIPLEIMALVAIGICLFSLTQIIFDRPRMIALMNYIFKN